MEEKQIHQTAAKGFGTVEMAKHYDSIRPSFSTESISFMETLLKGHVVELGAGTGIQTKWLSEFDCEITTTEPVEGMFHQLKSLVNNISGNRTKKIIAVQSSAENIPAEDNSIDAVFVAQAFHWFDLEKAIKEIHRVLEKMEF